MVVVVIALSRSLPLLHSHRDKHSLLDVSFSLFLSLRSLFEVSPPVVTGAAAAVRTLPNASAAVVIICEVCQSVAVVTVYVVIVVICSCRRGGSE